MKDIPEQVSPIRMGYKERGNPHKNPILTHLTLHIIFIATSYSFATLPIMTDPKTFRQTAGQIARILDDQGIPNILWGYAALGLVGQVKASTVSQNPIIL